MAVLITLIDIGCIWTVWGVRCGRSDREWIDYALAIAPLLGTAFATILWLHVAFDFGICRFELGGVGFQHSAKALRQGEQANRV